MNDDGSVKNLIQCLPLVYREEVFRLWLQKDRIGLAKVNERRTTLTTDSQRRAHDAVPLLCLVAWFECKPAERRACVWCFLRLLHENLAWIVTWSVESCAVLHERLAQSLLAHFLRAVEHSVLDKAGDSFLCVERSEANLRHRLTSISKCVPAISELERWLPTFRSEVADTCLNLTALASRSSKRDSVQGLMGAVLLLCNLARLPSEVDQLKHVSSEDHGPGRDPSRIRQVLIVLKAVLALLESAAPLTQSQTRFLSSVASETSRDAVALDGEVDGVAADAAVAAALQHAFFRVAKERLPLFCEKVTEAGLEFAVVSRLLKNENALLDLTDYQIERVASLLLAEQVKRSAAELQQLERLLLMWIQTSTSFDLDRLVESIPLVPVALRPKRGDDASFQCEVAECSLALGAHVELESDYVYQLDQLLTRVAKERQSFSTFYALCKRACCNEDDGALSNMYVKLLEEFVGLQDARILGILRFWHTGCLLDLISWFAQNAQRLSPDHFKWLEMSIRLLGTEGYSSLIADIVMFLIDEETTAAKKSAVPDRESLLLVGKAGMLSSFVGTEQIQIQKSRNMRQLLDVLCRTKAFDFSSLTCMTRFITACQTTVATHKDKVAWSLQKAATDSGYPLWLHCIDRLLQSIVSEHVPEQIRQFYSPEMPDVDEQQLKTRHDPFRDLRDLADALIAATHTRVLCFSGDPNLLSTALSVLHSSLIIHTTCCISLLSRIRQVWSILRVILDSPIISRAAIRISWQIMGTASRHARDFTLTAIGEDNLNRYKVRWPQYIDF